jgi:hypothetical protein
MDLSTLDPVLSCDMFWAVVFVMVAFMIFWRIYEEQVEQEKMDSRSFAKSRAGGESSSTSRDTRVSF